MKPSLLKFSSILFVAGFIFFANTNLAEATIGYVTASAGATDAGGAWSYTTSAPSAAGNIIIVQVLQDAVSATNAISITSATNVENLAGTDNVFTTIAATQNVGSAAAGYQYLFIGRALNTSAIVITGANSTADDIYVRVYEFSGVATGTALSDVLENSTAGTTANGAATSTTAADTSVVTLGANRLALNFVALTDDAMGLAAFAGETGGDWALATAIYESSTGTDGTLGLMSASIASAETIDGGSDTITSIAWGVVGFALIPAPVTVSGTANGNNGATVRIAVNGAKVTTSPANPTISGSAWSATIPQPSANDIITAWVESVADANEATAVTKYSSGLTVSGMVLNDGVATVGSSQNTSVSVTDMGSCDADTGTNCTEDIMYTSNSGALVMQSSSAVDTLSVKASNTLTATSASSETISTEAINNAGTITMTSSPTITLTGTTGTLFTNTGTFTEATSTVEVTSASGTPTLLSAAETFHILKINAGATVVNAGAAITIADASGSKLYVQSGVLNDSGLGIATSGSTNNTLQIDSGGTLCLGGAAGSNTSATCNTSAASTTARSLPSFATYTLDASSTIIFMSDAATTVSNTPTYGNLKLNPLFVSTDRIYTLGGAMTINGNFTITPDESGAGTPALTVQSAGTITVGSTKTTTISKANSATSKLCLKQTTCSSGSSYNLSTGLLNVATGGTLDATSTSSTISLTGTSGTLFTLGGTFTITSGTPTVDLTGNGDATVNSGAITFYNLTSSGTGTKTMGGDVTVNNALTISAGTFDVAANTIAVTGATSVTGTLKISSTTGTKTFTGNVTINSSGVWNETAAEDIAFAGNLTNNQTFTASTGVHTFSGTAKTISGTVSIPNLTISGTTQNDGTLTVSTALAGTSTLTNGATGTLNIGQATTPLSSGTLTATASGNIVNYTAASPNCKVTTYDTLNFSGSGTVTCAVTSVTNDITLSGTVSWTTTSSIALTDTLSIGSGTAMVNANGPYTLTAANVAITSTGTLTNNGVLTISTALSGTGELINAATGTLNLGGTTTITTLTATASGNIVEYTKAGAQTIKATTYDTLQFSGAGSVKTAGGNLIINTLFLTGGLFGIFDPSTYTVQGDGSTTIQVVSFTTIRVPGATVADTYTQFSAQTLSQFSTVDYNRAGDQTISSTWLNGGILYTSGSGVKTLSADQTFRGVNIGTGTTFALDGHMLTVTGDGTDVDEYYPFIATGTFCTGTSGGSCSGTGTVKYTYDSTYWGHPGSLTIPTTNISYYNLIIVPVLTDATTNRNIALPSVTIGGDLTVSASGVDSDPYTSTINPGAHVVVTGTTTINATGTTAAVLDLKPAGTPYNLTTTAVNIGAGGTLDAGSSTSIITLTGTGTVWDMNASGTITPGTSTIKLSNDSASAKTFAGGGKTYNDIVLNSTAGTGTGTFNITGSNTFANFRDDGTGAHIIVFDDSSTTTITSLTLDTDSAHNITLQSVTSGTGQWTFSDDTGTNTVSYITIKDACVVDTDAIWDADDGTNIDGGNNCTGDTGWNIIASITVAGTANGNGDAVVRVSVNGGAYSSGSVNGGGTAWTVSVPQPDADDIITAWVDNVIPGLEATAVTKYSSGNVTGMVLDTNVLTIGSNQNTTVSATDLGLCDQDTGAGCADEDIMHTSNSGALIVDGTPAYDGEVLSILSGNTLTVDSGDTETVTTEKISNAGTITSVTSPTYTLTGVSGTLFTNSGTFTPATSEVIVTSASGSPTLLSAGTTFHRLTINADADVINAGASITMSSASALNRLYIQKGVLNDGGNQIVGTANGTLVVDGGAALCIGGTAAATNATCDSGATPTTATTFPTNYTNGNITLASSGGSSFSLISYADGLGTTSSANTTGADLIVLMAGSNITSVSDSNSNTWTPLTRYGPTAFISGQLFYSIGPVVGSGHTFSVAGGNEYIAMQAFSGVDTVTPFDVENGNVTGSSVTSFQGGSVTPSNNNSLIVSGLATGVSSSTSVDSGFTLTNQTDAVSGINYGGAMGYKIQTSAAAVDPTWSWTGAGVASVANAVFKDVGGGGSASTVYYNANAATTVSAEPDYGDLKFRPILTTGRTYTLGATMTVDGDFDSNPSGGGSARALTINQGGSLTVAGTTTLEGSSSGTTTLDTGSNYALNSDTLNITTGDTLTANGSTITLSGTDGTPFIPSGTFTGGTSTVVYTGDNAGGNTTVGNAPYYNLTLNNATETYVLGADLVGNDEGTLTITNGTLSTTGSNYDITTGKINIANTASAILTANASDIILKATSGTLFTKGTSGVFTAGTSTVKLGSLTTSTINSGSPAFYSLQINNGGTYTAGANFTADTIYVANTGYLDAGDYTITATGSKVMSLSDNGHIKVKGTTFTDSYPGTWGVSCASNFDINYYASGAQTINEVCSGTDIRLITSGSGTKTLGASQSYTSATIGSGTTLALSDKTLTLSGSGTPLVATGTFSGGTGTVAFTNNGSVTVPAVSYYNLNLTPTIDTGRLYTLNATTITHDFTINPTAASAVSLTVEMGANLVVTGTTTISGTTDATSNLDAVPASNFNLTTSNLDIETAGTFWARNSTLTLTGTSGTLLVEDGSFEEGNSTVVMNPNADITMTSGNPTFYNLTLSPTLTGNHEYTGLPATTIGGDFTMNPSGSANSLTVNLASNLNVTGTTLLKRTGGSATSVLDTVSGDYTMTTGKLNIDTGGTLTMSGTFPSLFLDGTSGPIFTNNGTFNPGSSITYFTGDADITLTSGTIAFAILRLQPTLTDNRTYTIGAGVSAAFSSLSSTCVGVFAVCPTSGSAKTLTVELAGDMTVSGNGADTGGTVIHPRGSSLAILDTTASGHYAFSTPSLVIDTGGEFKARSSNITLTDASDTLIYNTGAYTAGTSTTELSGDGDAIISSEGITFNNLTLSGTGIKTLGDTTVADGNLIISDGTLQVGDANYINIFGTTTINSGGTVDDNNGATNPNGFAGLITINSGGTWTSTGNEDYVLSGGLTVNSGGSFTSGSGGYSLQGEQTVGGAQSYTISGFLPNNNTGDGVTLSGQYPTIGVFNLNSSGAIVTFAGTVPNISTVFNSGSSTVQYTGSGQTVKSMTYQNLVIKNSGTKTLGGDIAVEEDLTIGTGATLDPDTYTVTASGTNTLDVTGTIFVRGTTFADSYADFDTKTFNTGSSVGYYKAGDQTVDSLAYDKLYLGAGGTKTLGGNATSSYVTVETNTTLDPTADYSITGSGGSDVLRVFGTALVKAATFGGNYSGFETKIFDTNSTMNYALNGAQTIDNTLSYYNLTASGGATAVKTLGGDMTIQSGGTLTVEGAIFDPSTYQTTWASSSGDLSVNTNGTLRVVGTNFSDNYSGFSTTHAGGSEPQTVAYTKAGAQTITTPVTSASHYIIGGSGTKSAGGSISVNNTLTLSGGTFDTTGSNYAVNVGKLVMDGGNFNPRSSSITLGTGLVGTKTIFDYQSGTYTRDGETITLVNTSGAKTFAGGGQSFNKVVFAGTGGDFTISGDNNFNTFRIQNPPYTVKFTEDSTQTVTNWDVNGSESGGLLTLNSTTSSVPWYLYFTPPSKGSGTISSDYLSLKDSHADGDSNFSDIYAGASSINNGGNDRWIFATRSRGGGAGGVENSSNPSNDDNSGGGQGSGDVGTCSDGIKNADETDIDEGGRCGGAGAGNCADGQQNGNETGVDTGGRCSNTGGGQGGGEGDVGFLRTNKWSLVASVGTLNLFSIFQHFFLKI